MHPTGATENYSGSSNLCGNSSRLANSSVLTTAEVSPHTLTSQVSPLESTETLSNTNNCTPSPQEHVSFYLLLSSNNLQHWELLNDPLT